MQVHHIDKHCFSKLFIKDSVCVKLANLICRPFSRLPFYGIKDILLFNLLVYFRVILNHKHVIVKNKTPKRMTMNKTQDLN